MENVKLSVLSGILLMLSTRVGGDGDGDGVWVVMVMVLTENWNVLEDSSKTGFLPLSDTFVFCLFPNTITWDHNAWSLIESVCFIFSKPSRRGRFCCPGQSLRHPCQEDSVREEKLQSFTQQKNRQNSFLAKKIKET